MPDTYSRILVPPPPSSPPRPAVFLDRDGVIVEEVGYLHRVEDLRFIEGSLEAIGRLNRAGFAVVIITNQAGVGRGYYTWNEFENVQRHIETSLAAHQFRVNGVWACASLDHPWRKPNPGMLTDAAARLAIDLPNSWLVGDRETDIEAGIRAGLHHTTLVLTGYGQSVQDIVRQTRWTGDYRLHIAADLSQAVDLILEESTLPAS